jgi:hypothetical protein
VVEFRVAGAAGQDSTYGSYRARGQRGGADAARRALALDPVCADGVSPAGATGAACEAWDVDWVARPEGWYYTGLGNPVPRGEARSRPRAPSPPASPAPPALPDAARGCPCSSAPGGLRSLTRARARGAACQVAPFGIIGTLRRADEDGAGFEHFAGSVAGDPSARVRLRLLPPCRPEVSHVFGCAAGDARAGARGWGQRCEAALDDKGYRVFNDADFAHAAPLQWCAAPPRLPLHAPWRLRPVFVRAAPDARRAHRHCSGEYCAGDSLTWASVHADLPSASVPDACPAGRRNRYLILTEDDFAAGGALRLCGKGGRGQQPPACARLPAGWCAPRPPALRSRAWPQRARRERRRARADACARAQVLQHVVHGQQLAGRERGLRVRPRAPPPPPARHLPAARPLCSAPALGDSMLSAGRRKQGL